jgi:DNA-binding NtrC family response regulator
VQDHKSSRIVIATDSTSELITMGEMERRYLRHVLAAVGGNKTHAARLLGLNRRSLYRRLHDQPGVPEPEALEVRSPAG